MKEDQSIQIVIEEKVIFVDFHKNVSGNGENQTRRRTSKIKNYKMDQR